MPLTSLFIPAALFIGIVSVQAQEEDSALVFERFLGAIVANEALPAARKEAAMKAIAEAQEKDADAPLAAAMASGLQALYPELGEAIAKANEGKGHGGLRALYKLSRSKDRFLAAEAAYVMARTLFSQQRYEECLPFLVRLRNDLVKETLRDGDILYYQGVAMANGLKKEEAIALLARYLEDYPDASDRLRLSAQATLDGIIGVLDGSVEDIADHMDFSHRRLSFEDSGENTKKVQKKIVAMLDEIIAKAEEQQQQQQQQQGAAGGEGSQGQQQQAAGGQGQNASGNPSAQKDPLSIRNLRGAAKSAWDDLRKRAREAEALSGLKSKYPPRYRELVEQYFRDLQRGEQGEGGDAAAPGQR